MDNKTRIIIAILKLIEVKSILSFAVISVFTYLSIKGLLPSEFIASTITAVITYFFTRQMSQIKTDPG